MRALRQILAITRTEFRFGLRRGGPVVIPLLIGLLLAAGILMNPFANLSLSKDDFNQVTQNPDTMKRLLEQGWTVESYAKFLADGMADLTVFSTGMAWPILLLTSFVLLPTVTSVTIPADRKFGVGELLCSMPVNGGVYLAGKLLGVGLTVLLFILPPLGLFFGILEWVFLRAYQVNLPLYVILFFLEFTLLDWLPLLAWGLSVGVLVGTPFHSRRAALFPGLLSGILSIVLWLAAFKAPGIDFMQMDRPLYYLLLNYHSRFYDTITRMFGGRAPSYLGENPHPLGFGQLLIMYGVLFLILFFLAVLARLWLHWKENI